MTTTRDQQHMRRALRLADRPRGRTSPNPRVGAVVVAQDGSVVGEGWHEGSGRAHAEVLALEAAGERARGGTLYVTLAPCTRHGRTPPCAPMVASSGIARLVIGTPDPNPAEAADPHAGYEAAGITVVTGVEEIAAKELIAPFATWVTTGRPLVVVKVAATLDGRVAAPDGSSRWVTGPTARRDGHRLRARADAVLAGIGTVLADDPKLTVRLRGYDAQQPLRVVLDSTGRLPMEAAVLDGAAPTLIATTAKATPEYEAAVAAAGAQVARVGSHDGRVDVAALLDELGRRQVATLLVEGGPTVVGDLVERGLVDRYVFYLAPKLLGQAGLGAIAGLIVPNIADARELTITSVRRMGADVKIEARPRR